MVKCFLLTKYVYDALAIVDHIGHGTRWCKHSKELRWKQTWEDEDVEKERSNDDVTMTAFVEMASSIYPAIKFTKDIAENHENNKVTVIDLSVWREGENKLKHTFYEKPMVSSRVIIATLS